MSDVEIEELDLPEIYIRALSSEFNDQSLAPITETQALRRAIGAIRSAMIEKEIQFFSAKPRGVD